ncbi:hypothetical protein [Streptomyces justiciae]|uniref:hypothetical protein n=1 Tax=Streptomyces justiciae TaxID=2780140 RepID=UPI002117DD0E|nr:hypothetical protein [Streptomyces justiciae]MCW8378278.1 hypothetical protein [Streptomyces justiciae]
MRKAGEVSGGFQSALAAPVQPTRFTTRIPDSGAIPLDRLAEVDSGTLNRVLKSVRPARPTFTSGP